MGRNSWTCQNIEFRKKKAFQQKAQNGTDSEVHRLYDFLRNHTENSGSEQEGDQMRLQCASPSWCRAPCGNIQNMSLGTSEIIQSI